MTHIHSSTETSVQGNYSHNSSDEKIQPKYRKSSRDTISIQRCEVPAQQNPEDAPTREMSNSSGLCDKIQSLCHAVLVPFRQCYAWIKEKVMAFLNARTNKEGNSANDKANQFNKSTPEK